MNRPGMSFERHAGTSNKAKDQLAVSSPSLSTPSDKALALKAQFARDALRAELAGDAIKAKIARDSSRLVAWMDSMPGEALLIELFGYSAHVFAWTDHCLGRSLVRKGKQRQRRPRASVSGGLLTAAQAAAKLNCSIKTLNGHVKADELKYVIIGHGMKRPRKMFTDADLNQFIVDQTRKDIAACPSTSPRVRHTGTSTSKCEVIGFTARRNARRAAKPKK
jgi:hypothetical protein